MAAPGNVESALAFSGRGAASTALGIRQMPERIMCQGAAMPMSIEELVDRVTESSTRRVAAAKALEQVKAGIVGEDTEAAIHHLFAVTNHLLATQHEDFECIIDLVKHLSGVDIPHLRLVSDDD